MKIIKYIPLLLLNFSCSAQTNLEKYIIDDDGITVEKTDSTKQYDDVYNTNNIIYKVGKKFTYSYFYQNKDGEKFLVMSQTAYQSLNQEQVSNIEKYCEIIYSDLNTIEVNGGGSARCMLAEVFLPKK